jgi:hypothetical protein
MIHFIKDWALFSAILLYTVWLFFTAVMRLREVKDAGNLTFARRPVNAILGYFTLLIGAILDVVLNFAFFTVIGLEIPKRGEWLSTARMCRWYECTDVTIAAQWRRDVAKFFGAQVLDDIDPDGKHIH